MNSKEKDKYLTRVAYMYGVIVALINYLGFLLAVSGGMPVAETDDYRRWLDFMSENQGIINLFSVLSFVSPIVIIFFYSFTSKDKKIRRIINLPFIYSAIGSLGWILSFLMELACLIFTKFKYHINISEIVTASLLNILQECICIFTLAFLILDFIHRKIVLPKVFPDGNLGRFKIKLKPSVKFTVGVFYFSVGIFPIFFLTSTLITIARNNNIHIKPSIFVILLFVIVFSIIILWTFGDYLSTPIKKLQYAAQRIKAGDYGYKVDIVSNDDFGELVDVFNDMSVNLADKNKKIQAIQDSIIKGMAVMVESRDNSTGGHINRTSDCVKVFVDKLSYRLEYEDISQEYWDAIIKAAPMHDLGKIAVDDAVLRKPGKFTDEEYEKMKAHSAEGARIVENVLSQVDDEEFKQIAINVAHYHHEKWNGQGYPERISGEEIPFEARIMALADVFDALVSKRCYKESFTYDVAFNIIEESLGSHFDPKLGRLFIECRADLEALYNSYPVV